MKDSIKNKLREDLNYYNINDDKTDIDEGGAEVLDNDVWVRLENSLATSLKVLANEYASEFEGGTREAFGHLVEIINRRYGTDY